VPARRLSRGWVALVVWPVVLVDVVLTALVVVDRLPAGQMASSSASGVLLAAAVESSFLVVGALLALRRPEHVVAWLLLGVATLWPLWSVAFADVAGGWVPPIVLLGVQLLLRFPDGALPSRRWRWFSTASWVLLVVLTVVMTTTSPTTNQGAANPYYVAWTEPFVVLVLLLPVWVVASAVSLVLRYRRADRIVREQIRWLAWAGSVVAVLYSVVLGWSIAVDASGPRTGGAVGVVTTVLESVTLASFVLLPVSVGVAILRYRLYEIDRIISRTASYTVVTALVVATFAVVVLLLGRLLPSGSQLAVALATLAAAAVVRPLLAAVRARVDRWFNRTRYDARRVVEAFGARLRDEVHASTVVEDLRGVVATTLEPARVTVWLRDHPAQVSSR
jgi:hypothetical protein